MGRYRNGLLIGGVTIVAALLVLALNVLLLLQMSGVSVLGLKS